MMLSHDREDVAGSPATLLQAADTAIAVTAATAAILSLVLLFLSLMAEVVVRYLTTQGLGWPSEMPNILFPWLVMGGVVLAAQHGAHISVTLTLDLLNRRMARALLLVTQVVVAATFFYLTYMGFTVLEITGSEVFPVTGVSSRWAYLALIAGFAGVALTAVVTFLRLLIADDPRAVRTPSPEDEQ